MSKSSKTMVIVGDGSLRHFFSLFPMLGGREGNLRGKYLS